MGILRSIDRRREPRRLRELPLMVWGVDGQGERFLQEARAGDISIYGALLSGLDADLKSGDVIGVLFGKNKARYRVVWVRYDGAGDKMLVAVHRLESDACPWLDLLVEAEPTKTQQQDQDPATPYARRPPRPLWSWFRLFDPYGLCIDELADADQPQFPSMP